MNKHLPRKITDIKGKVALAELQRTHFIVVMLSIGLIVLLAVHMLQLTGFGFALGVTAVTLLVILSLMSLFTAIGLSKLIKK
ncbi:MAG: hypothetical protein UY35_C0005G0027 [Candidatus Saccharibacteria bacterium GW2011_GWC2_48_9]|nr:MAG: hypothetical protein UY35_C0005G0027 [Candidatus Saccharibacteria bacterium GW2011_GWC2_48_9]HCH34190.1 hypothetical protein [Candidatus Saccharibacteria bacterium]